MKGRLALKLLLIPVLLVMSCTEESPVPPVNNGGGVPNKSTICKVNEMEFRDRDDIITGIRDFQYNINQSNRLESITIVEGLDLAPVTLRFQFLYNDDNQITLPTQMNEVLGGDVVTNTIFRYDADGNLAELIHNQLEEPFTDPPEFLVFFYEDSELANDSINARIIVFDIDRLTRHWIDVLPAIFTQGGRRITRFENQTFRGDIRYYCDFSYDSQGFLSEIVCRSADFVLTEVWDFTYENGRLSSAFHQEPNFRAIATYDYDALGKPISVVSTTGGFINWKASYFYLCL